ncbi:hypothetical protein D3C86_520210 [compost metagenome]
MTTRVPASFNWSSIRVPIAPDVMLRCTGRPRAVSTLDGSRSGDTGVGTGTTSTGTWRRPSTFVSGKARLRALISIDLPTREGPTTRSIRLAAPSIASSIRNLSGLKISRNSGCGSSQVSIAIRSFLAGVVTVDLRCRGPGRVAPSHLQAMAQQWV